MPWLSGEDANAMRLLLLEQVTSIAYPSKVCWIWLKTVS